MIHTSIFYSHCNDFTVQIVTFWVNNIQFLYLCTASLLFCDYAVSICTTWLDSRIKIYPLFGIQKKMAQYCYGIVVVLLYMSLHCGIKTGGICGILSAPAWQAPAPSLSLRPTVTWYTQLQDHHHHHQDYHQDYYQNTTTTLSLQPTGRIDVCRDRRDQRDLQSRIFFLIAQFFWKQCKIIFDLCNFT